MHDKILLLANNHNIMHTRVLHLVCCSILKYLTKDLVWQPHPAQILQSMHTMLRRACRLAFLTDDVLASTCTYVIGGKYTLHHATYCMHTRVDLVGRSYQSTSSHIYIYTSQYRMDAILCILGLLASQYKQVGRSGVRGTNFQIHKEETQNIRNRTW